MNEEPKSPWLDANEIKKRVSLEEVLERRGILKTLTIGGEDQRRGPSPFHGGSDLSFSCQLSRGVWNDLKGRPLVDGRVVPGNVIGLVMGLEKKNFRDALLSLQHEFLDVTGETRTEIAAAVDHSPGPPPDQNDVFGTELRGLRHDVPLLQERGISAERAKYHGVGYATRGLMKSRVVFPIRNVEGQLVAYVGRSLKENDQDGVWRSPKGFHRSLELCGIDAVARDEETRAAVAKHGLILVQSPLARIVLAESGFKNTVATLEAGVSQAQQAMILDPKLNPSRKVTLFFNFDEPGREGRKKAAGQLINESFVRYVDSTRFPRDKCTEPEDFPQEALREMLLR